MTLLIVVWLLHTLALMVPGANFVLISYLAASGRKLAAVYAAFGIALGALIWASTAALGLSALFLAFPQIRLGVQIAGGLYLLYLAVLLWRAKVGGSSEESGSALTKAFFRGLVVNLSNPKSVLFFASIFSTTLASAEVDSGLLFSAVLLLFVNGLLWHLLLAFAFSHPKIRYVFMKFEAFFSKIAGALFGALGGALLINSVREMRS